MSARGHRTHSGGKDWSGAPGGGGARLYSRGRGLIEGGLEGRRTHPGGPTDPTGVSDNEVTQRREVAVAPAHVWDFVVYVHC